MNDNVEERQLDEPEAVDGMKCRSSKAFVKKLCKIKGDSPHCGQVTHLGRLSPASMRLQREATIHGESAYPELTVSAIAFFSWQGRRTADLSYIKDGSPASPVVQKVLSHHPLWFGKWLFVASGV